jgi:DNA-binding NarL/FixJ family response regulator
MTLYDRELQKRRKQKVVELLEQGLTTRQIAERVGTTTRTVLRIKKQALENTHVHEEAT